LIKSNSPLFPYYIDLIKNYFNEYAKKGTLIDATKSPKKFNLERQVHQDVSVIVFINFRAKKKKEMENTF
jgi:hypothetical protein